MYLEKVVDETRPYVSKKDGKTRPSVNYYLVADVGNDQGVKQVRISILPKFSDSQRDWFSLDVISKLRHIKAEE